MSIATQKPAKDGTVYGIGFPSQSTSRVQFNAPDADGNSQYLSKGKALDVQQVSERSGQEINAATREVYEKSVLLTDVDAMPGSSGGPYLNAAGEVVGLFTMNVTEDENAVTPQTLVTIGPTSARMAEVLDAK